MRRLLWVFSAALLTAASARADDGWQKALSFPLTSNTTAAGRAVTFTDPADGRTYAYFGADTANGAQVWRSSDGVNWSQVNVDGFGSQSGEPFYSDVAWFSSYTVAGIPYVYVGVTPNTALGDGIAVFRSAGGSSTSQWTQVFSSATTGGGQASAPGGGPGVSLTGNFYFGTTDATNGTQIWKSTAADGLSPWLEVDPGGGFGEGPSVNLETTYLKVFGGNLYAATGCATGGPACGQIWKSTGTLLVTDTDTWTQVLAATNTFDAHTTGITALESFAGQLYAATMNSAGDAQLWRTSTPDTGGWTAVKTADSGCATCFASALTPAVVSLRAIAGFLYASTWNTSAGLVVYRSPDGANWTRSNASAGFGTINNQYLGDFAQLGTAVVGDTFNSSGGALWSALLPGAAGAPGQPSASSVAQTSLTWSWPAAAGATSYDVYEASSPATLLGTSASASFLQSGLSPNTPYGIDVAAVSGVGQSTLSASGFAFTLAAPPSGLALGQVYSSSITLSWSANGNPGGTSYQVQYWLTAGSTTTVTTTATNATLTGLLDGAAYFVTVQAVNGAGVAAPSGTTLTATTVSVPSLTTVVTSTGASILFNTQSGVAALFIPPGAFNQTVTVTISTAVAGNFPTAGAPAAQQLTATGVGIQVDVAPAVEPLKTATLIVPFTAAEMLAFDVNDLGVARYDSLENVWVPLAGSVSASNRQITALTDHLSLFQIMQVTAGGAISSAKAFPNPLRPALGESYMTFSELPAGARVRIYTLTGVLVKDLTADATGTVDWDATNDGGSEVASGVYFVYAQAGGQHRTLKVAVQR